MRKMLKLGTAPAAWLVLACILCMGLVSSCGDDDVAMTAADYNNAAWSSYAGGDYTDARSDFETALDLDPDMHEARLGIAWCDAHDAEYDEAMVGFDTVITSGDFATDAFAGRAAAAHAADLDSLAIASADSALARDADYEFSRKEEYNWRDLRLILAQACFALGLYAEAQAEVDILDPGNGLDPANETTWEVGGQAQPTYEAALALLIEALVSDEGVSAFM